MAGNEVKIVVSGEDRSNAALASATKNVDGMGGSLRRIGETAAGINLADKFSAVSESAKAFLSNTANAASGLEQSMGAVDSVFKGSAGQIHAWGGEAAETVGLSERSFNEAASSIGSLLNNLGFDMEETTAKTGDLTKRAADMAAMFGGDTSEAIDAIGSALRGESDPIERYGVMLNDATVSARAMADTGKTTADSLTMQEKAAARLALILEQTSDAAGTFAREGETLAGSQQRMTAAIEDAQAAIGSMFTPIVAAAADVLTGLVNVFQELPGPIKFVTGALIVMVAAASAIAPMVTAATTAMGAMGVGATGVKAAMSAVGSFIIGPWGAAIAAGIAVMSLFAIGSSNAAERQERLQAAGKSVNDAIREQNGAIDENVRKVAYKNLQDEGAIDNANKIGISSKDVVNAYIEQGDTLDNLRDRLNRYIDAHSHMEDGQIVMDREGAAAQLLLQQLDGLVEGRNADTEAARAEAEATGANTDAAEAATKANQEQADAINETTDALLASRDAQRGLRDAIADANEVMKDSKATDDEKQAALDNIVSSTMDAIAATRDSADANRDGTLSQQELTDSTNTMSATLAQGRDAFLQAAHAAGIEEGAANALADQLGLIPSRVFTKIELEAMAAISNLAAFKRALDNIPRRVGVDVSVRGANISGTGGHMQVGQAAGGVTGARAAAGGARNGPTLINEADGAGELVELPSGSRVMTAGATRAYLEQGLMGGGGATQVVLSMDNSDPLVRAIMGAIRVTIRNEYGGDVAQAFNQRNVS